MHPQVPMQTDRPSVNKTSASTNIRKAKAVLRGKELAVEAYGSEHAVDAIEQLLQPLAQLMVGHSVQLGAVTELLKKSLVDAALRSDTNAKHAMTDSGIAILTGVHRKDVRRLRDEPEQMSAAEAYAPLMSMGAQVVARWISDPVYLSTHNKARALARTPRHAKPGEPDFTTLVAQVSSDVGARAVLDELLRLGIIKNSSETHVELQDNAFVPQEGLKETFHFLAANVSDHLATAVHNLQPDRADGAMLEQSAFSQNLSEEDAADLELTARHLWANALQQFLQKATVAEQRSSKKTDATRRVRFGIYFHTAAMASQPEAVEVNKKTTNKAKP
jgi:Family of unknown function (DUF6502)